MRAGEEGGADPNVMAFLSVDLLPAVEGSCGGGSIVVDTPDMEMMDVSPRVVSAADVKAETGGQRGEQRTSELGSGSGWDLAGPAVGPPHEFMTAS